MKTYTSDELLIGVFKENEKFAHRKNFNPYEMDFELIQRSIIRFIYNVMVVAPDITDDYELDQKLLTCQSASLFIDYNHDIFDVVGDSIRVKDKVLFNQEESVFDEDTSFWVHDYLAEQYGERCMASETKQRLINTLVLFFAILLSMTVIALNLSHFVNALAFGVLWASCVGVVILFIKDVVWELVIFGIIEHIKYKKQKN